MSENGIHIHLHLGPEIEAFLPKIQALLEGLPKSVQPSEPDEIMTIDDLSSLWKVPKQKIYGLTMQTGPGSLPRFKIGRDLRFYHSEVVRWADEQRVK